MDLRTTPPTGCRSTGRRRLGVPVTLSVVGPPGRPHQPAVHKAGDLLHYAIARDQWERRSQGEGSKGQRYYDWAWFDVALPGQEPADGFAHHLLIRRSTKKKQLAGARVDFEYAYFLVHHRRDAALPEAVGRAGVPWKIEENNEQAKQITGLGQYQVRRWNSWHRHATCAMLALAFLTVQRSQRPGPEPAAEDDAAADNAPEQGDEQGKDRQAQKMSTCR